MWVNRPVARIPAYTSPKSHNAPFCKRNVCTCMHISVKKLCFLGYSSDAMWGLRDASIESVDSLVSSSSPKMEAWSALVSAVVGVTVFGSVGSPPAPHQPPPTPTGHRWILLTKASDAELWYLLWSAPEQTVDQTIETPVSWDAITLIWRHRNVRWSVAYHSGADCKISQPPGQSPSVWVPWVWVYSVPNTLRPTQNGRYSPDETSKCIFRNENIWI